MFSVSPLTYFVIYSKKYALSLGKFWWRVWSVSGPLFRLPLITQRCAGNEVETNQGSTISFTRENSKIFNITSKYFSIFSNKPPAGWVAHITRYFITCYSSLYYSFILTFRQTIECRFTLKHVRCDMIITYSQSLFSLACCEHLNNSNFTIDLLIYRC